MYDTCRKKVLRLDDGGLSLTHASSFAATHASVSFRCSHLICTCVLGPTPHTHHLQEFNRTEPSAFWSRATSLPILYTTSPAASRIAMTSSTLSTATAAIIPMPLLNALHIS